MAKQRKVRVVQGVGRFVSPNEIEVDGEDGTAAWCASSTASSPPARSR
jgi:pyruvate/2-oxoglutarate dehydrogenase complex dihydrolipoamide dehydrogenase (E3) component